MTTKSVYIVQTQVIGLGDGPLSLKKEIKEAFHPLFSSKTCFTDLRTSILDLERVELDEDGDEFQSSSQKPVPLPGTPFIGLGQICFNTHSAIFCDHEDRTKLAINLAKREKYWEPNAKKSSFQSDLKCFGYDPALEDQRMNQLYFELYKPIYLTAVFNGETQATGRIHIHFLPSGYIVTHLAVVLASRHLTNLKTLGNAVLETNPWRKNTEWKWSSRIANGNLQSVLSFVKQKIINSLVRDKKSVLKIVEQRWFTSIKIATDEVLTPLANGLFGDDIKTIKLGKANRFLSDGGTRKGELIIAKHGLICKPQHWGRKPRLVFFSKVMLMTEFALLKNQIYADYAAFLSPEIVRLRDFRLSMRRKMTKEDVFEFSVYSSEIPRYLLALDQHIHQASPFYRLIYSSISSAIGFSERREKVKKLMDDWLSETEKWEHGLVIVWKKVISPLRSLFGLS